MAKKATDKATILSDRRAEFREHHLSRDKILGFLRRYKKEKGDPLNFTDSLCLVRSCVDFYRDHLVSLVQEGPYKKIHGLALEHMLEKKFDFENESLDTCQNFARKVSDCLSDLINGEFKQKISDGNIKYIRENLDRYLEILSAIDMVKRGETSGIVPSFVKSLYVLMYLMFTDLDLYGHFFRTDEIAKLINSEISARGPNKRWKTANELNKLAEHKIYDLWEEDDPRLHDKIAKDVVDEINEPILVPIKKILLLKYPDKDLNAGEMKKYKKELQAMSRGKVASARTVMGMIFQRALAKGRANDPQKGVRKFKEYRNE